MTTAENSVLYYEDGQTFVPMTELTDSGDHKSYDPPLNAGLTRLVFRLLSNRTVY